MLQISKQVNYLYSKKEHISMTFQQIPSPSSDQIQPYPLYNQTKYSMPQFPVVSKTPTHKPSNTHIGKLMSRISQVPEPSNTQSNLQITRQQKNKKQSDKRFKSQDNNNNNNIKMLSTPTMNHGTSMVSQDADIASSLHPSELKAQLDSLKQKTIYKEKTLSSSSYSTQQLYFGLFTAKKKSRELHSSPSNYLKTIKNENNQKPDNCKKNQISHSKDANKINNQLCQNQNIQNKQKLNDIYEEYNRLRKCLEQLEKQNINLKKNNHYLLKKNQYLQKNIERSSIPNKNNDKNNNNIVINTQKNQINCFNDESPLLITEEELSKIISNAKNNQDKSSIISQQKCNQSNFSQEDSTVNLLIRAQQQISMRDSIIKDLQIRLHELTVHNEDKINHLITKTDTSHIQLSGQNKINELITQFKNMFSLTNNEFKILNSKFERLYKKMNTFMTTVNTIMIKCQQQQSKIFKKQQQINLSIQRTKSILTDYNKQQQTTQFYIDQHSKNNFHQNKDIFNKIDINIKNTQSDQSTKFDIPCKSNHFDSKITLSPFQTSFSILQKIPSEQTKVIISNGNSNAFPNSSYYQQQ